jgi:hypothetical protein
MFIVVEFLTVKHIFLQRYIKKVKKTNFTGKKSGVAHSPHHLISD